MTRSMTAFTRQEQQQSWGTLIWELRSVNHRYLEPHFRLPESLRDIEGKLREQLRQLLSRGKVECTLRFIPERSTESMHIDQVRAQEVISALTQVSELIPESQPINPMEVMAWPGVLQESTIDMSEVRAQAVLLFSQALKDLVAGREREGTELAELIQQRLTAIEQITSDVRTLMPKILQGQRDTLRSRLTELSAELDAARLEQEIVLIAQKADVDEETDRLQTHVQEVRRVLKQKGPVGRRLDFLMQELNREANTLSSKSIVATTTRNAVELKVLIEQMREQIQNIE